MDTSNDNVKFKIACISSAGLHILAMTFMLSDHIWATLLTQDMWLTYIGRIAFPIFAFMIAEGLRQTKNAKKYLLRLLILAVISEIPFDIMYSGTLFYPYEQNVIWTFLIATILILSIERVKTKGNKYLTGLAYIGAFLLGGILGLLGMTLFNAAGVYTVFVFYIFGKRRWWCFIGQLVCLYYLNVELISGRTVFIGNIEIVMQGFALLALIPIWLYNGKKGYDKKWFRLFCYAFYPVHQLILGILQLL